MKIFHFVLDKGGKVELQQIAKPDVEFSSPVAVFTKALEHEKKVTKSINDLMDEVGKNAKESSWGLIALIREILSPVFGGKPPKILIVSPPILGKLSAFNEAGFSGKANESKLLPNLQKIVAEEAKCEYLDSNDHITVSDIDGVHPLDDQYPLLADAVFKKINEMKI